jgi:carboxyl-terminal processing protease
VKATRREILALAATGALGAWPAKAETASQPERALAGSNQTDFDQVWEFVRDRFYDPRFNGLDWQEERARFRRQAASAHSRQDAAAAIKAMLDKLVASHTRYYTPDEPAYCQLADIFAGRLGHHGLDRIFPKGDVSYPGIGVFTEADDHGRIFVTGVIDRTPA